MKNENRELRARVDYTKSVMDVLGLSPLTAKTSGMAVGENQILPILELVQASVHESAPNAPYVDEDIQSKILDLYKRVDEFRAPFCFPLSEDIEGGSWAHAVRVQILKVIK